MAKKKLVALLLVLSMCTGMTPTVFAAPAEEHGEVVSTTINTDGSVTTTFDSGASVTVEQTQVEQTVGDSKVVEESKTTVTEYPAESGKDEFDHPVVTEKDKTETEETTTTTTQTPDTDSTVTDWENTTTDHSVTKPDYESPDESEAAERLLLHEVTTTTTVEGSESTTVTKTKEEDGGLTETTIRKGQETTTTNTKETEIIETGRDTTFGSDITIVDENRNPIDIDTSWEFVGVHDTSGNYEGDFKWSDNRANFFVKDKDGNLTRLSGEGLGIRLVKNDDGEMVGGLYCLDIHTGTKTGVAYRIVNIEDAAAEGYFSEEDAEHIRYIMNTGYYTNVPADDGKQEENLGQMKERLLAAVGSGKLDLTEEQVNNLTVWQAVSATGMAVWQYGNRFSTDKIDPSAGESLVIQNNNNDPVVQKIYEYLIQGTLSATDTGLTEEQVISSDKFVDKLEFVVGNMVHSDDPNHVNNDDNGDNDIYDVGLKFSLVVTPDKDDDLVIKVINGEGKVVRQARIAGNRTGEEEVITADENGIYVLEGIQMGEGNTAINLKLEGIQHLDEGVYVFESQPTKLSTVLDATYEKWTTEEKWPEEQIWAFGKLKNKLNLEKPSQLTKELYKENLATLCGYDGEKYLNEDGSINGDYLLTSQNLIGKFDREAEVDVGMIIDLTFHVKESTVTETPVIWEETHTEYTPPNPGSNPGGGQSGEIPGKRPPMEKHPEKRPPVAEILEIPRTGDDFFVWFIMAMLSGSALLILYIAYKKKKLT